MALQMLTTWVSKMDPRGDEKRQEEAPAQRGFKALGSQLKKDREGATVTSQRFISSYPEKPQVGDWEGMKHGRQPDHSHHVVLGNVWLQQLNALSRRYASSPASEGTMR